MFWGQVFILQSKIRLNVSIRGISASLTAYSSLTNPLTIRLNKVFLRNNLHTKINYREILTAFRINLSILFHILCYFLCCFIVPPLGLVILLAFRVSSLSRYERICLMQKRNVTQKWQKVLWGSRLHSQSASLKQTGTEESFMVSCFSIAPLCRC